MESDNCAYKKVTFLIKRKSPFYYLNVYPFVLFYLVMISLYICSTFNRNLTHISLLNFHVQHLSFSFTSLHALFLFFATAISCQLLSVLFCLWSLPFRRYIQYMPCPSVSKATHVFVTAKTHCGPSAIHPLLKTKVLSKPHFVFQKIKCVFNPTNGHFLPIRYPTDFPLRNYISSKGLCAQEIEVNRAKYGLNEFEIPDITFLKLFIEHVSAPFFIFQILVVLLWSLDGYFGYSLMVLVMLVSFEAMMALRRLKNLAEVRNMRFPASPLYVYREKQWQEISSAQILPGDVISLVANKVVAAPCDALILDGSCVVNESLLTGESTPQLKEGVLSLPLNTALLDFAGAHRGNVVSSGTFVLSVSRSSAANSEDSPGIPASPDKGVPAFALQTSYSTNQGKLLRNILYSTEKVSINYDKEALKFIGLLLVVSILCSSFVFYKGISRPGVDIPDLLLNCVMIVTMVIPTDLPMVLSLAVNNSLMDLSKLKIFCSEGFRLPHAGALKHCFFDKTGTLTKDELHLVGFSRAEKFSEAKMPESVTNWEDLPPPARLVVGGCHSLTKVGSVAGDSVELAAFNASKLLLDKSNVTVFPGAKPPHFKKIKIVKRFPFCAKQKKMSCLIQTAPQRNQFYYVVKGAGESIRAMLCDVPAGFDETLSGLSSKGFRVIAMAYKQISYGNKDASKESLDLGVSFAGFLAFASPLRSDCVETVKELRLSGHKVAIITGDSQMTANYVAQESLVCTKQILSLRIADKPVFGGDEKTHSARFVWDGLSERTFMAKDLDITTHHKQYDLSINGEVFECLSNSLDTLQFEELLCYFQVYARMTPFQKELVLRVFRKQKIAVLMCGDGVNDVGALKQANIGIALAENKETPVTVPSESPASLKKNLSFKEKITALLTDSSADDPSDLHIDMNVASIASPFTIRNDLLHSVIDIVRQGRRTLIINLQMYQILALSCLINMALFSYEYLQNNKMSDLQATFSEVAATFMFLFVSSAQPLKRLSSKKPRSRVFTAYSLINIAGQMLVHLGIVYMGMSVVSSTNLSADTVNSTHFNATGAVGNSDSVFTPSLSNTFLFYLLVVMNITTFVVNYIGHPFMQSFSENRKFMKIVCGTASILFLCCVGFLPDVEHYLQLVSLSELDDFLVFMALFVLDFGLVFLFERLTRLIFQEDSYIDSDFANKFGERFSK